MKRWGNVVFKWFLHGFYVVFHVFSWFFMFFHGFYMAFTRLYPHTSSDSSKTATREPQGPWNHWAGRPVAFQCILSWPVVRGCSDVNWHMVGNVNVAWYGLMWLLLYSLWIMFLWSTGCGPSSPRMDIWKLLLYSDVFLLGCALKYLVSDPSPCSPVYWLDPTLFCVLS